MSVSSIMGQTATRLLGGDDHNDDENGPYLALPAPPSRVPDDGIEAQYRRELLQLVGLRELRNVLRFTIQDPVARIQKLENLQNPWHVGQDDTFLRSFSIPQIVCLHGPPGIGKTTLLRLTALEAGPTVHLHWLTTETDVEAADSTLEAEQRAFAELPHLVQHTRRQSTPSHLDVYVLDSGLVGRAYDCVRLWRRFIPRLLNHIHMTSGDWRATRPRLFVLLNVFSQTDLPDIIRNNIQRWAYARAPNLEDRVQILGHEFGRLYLALHGHEIRSLSQSTLTKLARLWKWWTPAHLVAELGQCAERAMQKVEDGNPSATAAWFAEHVPSWPDHDGRLRERQEHHRQLFAAFEGRYGKTGVPLDPPEESKKTTKTMLGTASTSAMTSKRPRSPLSPDCLRRTKRVRTELVEDPDPSDPLEAMDPMDPMDSMNVADSREEQETKMVYEPPMIMPQLQPRRPDSLPSSPSPLQRNESTIRLTPGFTLS